MHTVGNSTDLENHKAVLKAMMYGPTSRRPAQQTGYKLQHQHDRHTTAIPAQDSSSLSDSYLFSPHFVPSEDLLTVDAKPEHWALHARDVRMQQQLLADARDVQHSRFGGVVALQQARDSINDPSRQQQVDDILVAVQQELSDRSAVNMRLQQGVQDSFTVLGAYMRGLPTLHHQQQHQQQQALARQKTGPSCVQEPILPHQPGMDMAGGFAIPSGDDRPGNMSTDEYSTHIAPKLLALQRLSSEHGDTAGQPAVSTGLDRLQALLCAGVRDWRLQEKLEHACHYLHQEYSTKHNMYLRLLGGLLSLGIRLQCYITSSLVLRWHTRWLAGVQMDQPAQWIYDTLRLAANPYACVSYQIWQHSSAAAPNTHHSSFCIASGVNSCYFMWYSAPLSHAVDVPEVRKTILGGCNSWGSTTKDSSNAAKHAVSNCASTLPNTSTAAPPVARLNPAAPVFGPAAMTPGGPASAAAAPAHKVMLAAQSGRHSKLRSRAQGRPLEAGGHQVHARELDNSAASPTGNTPEDVNAAPASDLGVSADHGCSHGGSNGSSRHDGDSNGATSSNNSNNSSTGLAAGNAVAVAVVDSKQDATVGGGRAAVQLEVQAAPPRAMGGSNSKATGSYAAAAATFAMVAPKLSSGPRRVSADTVPASSGGSPWQRGSKGSRSFSYAGGGSGGGAFRAGSFQNAARAGSGRRY